MASVSVGEGMEACKRLEDADTRGDVVEGGGSLRNEQRLSALMQCKHDG